MNNQDNKQSNKFTNFISFIFTLILMIISTPLIILAFLIDYFQGKKVNGQSKNFEEDFEIIDIYSYLESYSLSARI